MKYRIGLVKAWLKKNRRGGTPKSQKTENIDRGGVPAGVAKAQQAAEAVVAQAVAHQETGEPIDGPGLIMSVLSELAVEDLHQLALHEFVTARYEDLPGGGHRNAGGGITGPGAS